MMESWKSEGKTQIDVEELTMIVATLTIGDVTDTDTPPRKSLALVRQDVDHLIFRWTNQDEDPIEGTLYIAADWKEFLDQVRKREPHRWLSDERLEGPMNEGGLSNVVRQVKTTPAYQLFLASIDVASFLELFKTGTSNQWGFNTYVAIRHFGEMNEFIPTEIKGGQLFFVPDEVIGDLDEATAELIDNGKLGRLALEVDHNAIGQKYYVPYSVPSGFTTKVSVDAKRLWDAIRTEYYSVRN